MRYARLSRVLLVSENEANRNIGRNWEREYDMQHKCWKFFYGAHINDAMLDRFVKDNGWKNWCDGEAYNDEIRAGLNECVKYVKMWEDKNGEISVPKMMTNEEYDKKYRNKGEKEKGNEEQGNEDQHCFEPELTPWNEYKAQIKKRFGFKGVIKCLKMEMSGNIKCAKQHMKDNMRFWWENKDWREVCGKWGWIGVFEK